MRKPLHFALLLSASLTVVESFSALRSMALRADPLDPAEFWPVVDDLVAQISEAEYTAKWQALDDFETRFVGRPENAAATEWIFDTLASYGLEVEYHAFQTEYGERKNVVGTLPGKDQNEVVYMIAHFDSISLDDSFRIIPEHAPGADDNASGVAALLETARVLSTQHFAKTIRFVAFNAEEIGLLGSFAYVADVAIYEEVLGVFNLDRVGDAGTDRTPPDLLVLGKRDSEHLSSLVAAAAERYVPDVIQVIEQVGTSQASDHHPFVEQGNAALFIKNDDWPDSQNELAHTTDDRIEAYGTTYPTHVTMAVTGAIAQFAEPRGCFDPELGIGIGPDCDQDLLVDYCQIFRNGSLDCNENHVLDTCELSDSPEQDCDESGLLDSCEILSGVLADCDEDGVPDVCQIADDPNLDCDENGTLDTCEISSSVLADCDKDGVPDVCQIAQDPSLDCDESGTLDVCDVTPNLVLEEALVLAPPESPTVVLTTDLDGDGILELATAADSTPPTVTVWRREQDGGYSGTAYPTATWRIGDVEAADLDGDELTDLIAANSGRGFVRGTALTFLWNRGATAFDVDIYEVDADPAHVLPADYDADSDIDIAVVHQATRRVVIHWNQGARVFTRGPEINRPSMPIEAVSADFNGDDVVDLALLESGSESAHILFNQGGGSFADSVPFAAGLQPIALAVTDFNQDSRKDLAIADSQGQQVVLLRNQGDGTFVQSGERTVAGAPRLVLASDFDGDGDEDLVTTHTNSSVFSVLWNIGGAEYGRQDYLSGAVEFADLSIANLIEDQLPEAIVADTVGGRIVVLANHTEPAETTDCDANRRPDSCDIRDGELADTNGDGIPDVCMLETTFVRCNSNADGQADLSDAVFLLSYLFLGSQGPSCHKAADCDDSGELDISDAIRLLGYLFLGGSAPPDPHGACGVDPTEDELTCLSFEGCTEP